MGSEVPTLVLPPNGDQTEHGRRRTPLGHRPPAEEEEGAEQPAQATSAGSQADLSLPLCGLRHLHKSARRINPSW